MKPPAYIYREKRLYNKWAASQTLEDYALRYTADHARKWSAAKVANTAIGASAFLACEAIGAAITLTYGFSNSVVAILAAVVLMFAIGFPIAYHSARHGLDIDLLTRGAGFGYLGSTITSLIYASFTFLLFSVEASIMAVALRAMFGVPMSFAYLLSSLVVIPIAIWGMSAITRFQTYTQPIWVVLQLLPIVYILALGRPALDEWSRFTGLFGAADGGVSLLHFGLAFSTLLSLLPQIGEQADYLRFLPPKARAGGTRWWLALIAGGPGWTLIGGAKLLLGSFLADYALRHGIATADAASPTDLFLTIFTAMTSHSGLALVVTGVFIITCQLKINVTNAYAGSIAWSNFFARLTHSHPGRVVWLIFNVVLALLLMEIGIIDAIEGVLIFYANVAAGWIGALAADLTVSKPLGLSPRGIEFKRAHLYDINPVGVGAMLLSIGASTLSLLGVLGQLPQAFAPAIGLAVAFVSAPAIALATRSRYYLARQSALRAGAQLCVICENEFEPSDMAHCPVYAAPICSLCCTLEARCHDRCKEDSRATQQVAGWLETLMPRPVARYVHTPVGHFVAVLGFITTCNAAVLGLIYWQYAGRTPGADLHVGPVLLGVFLVFTLLAGVVAWILVLAHESRRGAMRETAHHVQMLVEEIAAHDVTDQQLEKARQAAEAANAAKSRYLVSVSHEIRSPLNSIYGYAQLLERGSDVAPAEAAKVIRRSAEHLTNLVEGLLDISQVESGVLRINRDTVRLPAFLDQITNMFRPQAQAKGIGFVYDRPERLPEFVHTDQKRLRQILINLLSNAIKFTEQGQVIFRVKYRSQLATIEIIDTGIGIEADDLQRIFAPFERGRNRTALRQQGVGLGLSITNALIQILGGEIRVTSEPGKGTCFTIRLMLSQAAGSTAANADAPHSEAITGYAGPRRTILLIDDDPTQISVLRNLLEPISFTIDAALDGEAGITRAAMARPDLVLLDISMPGLSGWETAGLLRQAHGPAIRIVMVSADAHEYRRGGDGRDSHDMFLLKPVELNSLLDLIADQLDLQWLAASNDQDAMPTPDAAGGAPQKLPGEALPYLADLEQLVKIGHVRGIEGKIRELAAAVPQAAPVADEFLSCLDQFDLKRLAAAIKTRRAHAR